MMTDVAPTRLTVAPFGPPLRRALASAITEAKGGDAFVPVTVCVPSAIAGITVRRWLVSELGSLASVAISTLHQLADRLTASTLNAAGARPLLAVVNREAIRGALATLTSGPAAAFGPVAANPATEAALAATFAELRDLDDDNLDRLAQRSPRAAAAVSLFRLHRQLVSGWADERDRMQAATAVVAAAGRAGRAGPAGDRVLADVGTVVLYAPRRLLPAEDRLLAALAGAGRLVAVLGRTGDPMVDGETCDVLAARLAAWLGPPTVIDPSARPPTGTLVVRAPDAAEEARTAVRLVVERLEAGVPAERIAVVARTSEPYLLLLTEELAAAGIDHHAPSTCTLAQTAAGRGLLGLMALRDGDFRRVDLMAWLRSAPIVDPVGTLVPVARWDRLAREAGIAGGSEQWAQRLSRAIDKRAERLASREPVDGEPAEPDRRLADLETLRAFVEDVVVATEPPAPEPGGWASLARWADRLSARYLGDVETVMAWPAKEQEARVAVHEVLAALAGLDGLGLGAPAPDLALFRRVLEASLSVPAPGDGRLGRGVAVARLSDVVGADFDLVIVVGMAEGIFPPRPTDDPVVPNRERAAVGLAPRGLTRTEERRDYLATIAAAGERVLSFPRADTRSQRERQPARWLLETCATRRGSTAPVYGSDLAALRADPRASWFVDIESFEWWLGQRRSPATAHEYDIAALLVAHRAGVPLTRVPAVAAEPALARGLDAVTARQAGRFGVWTGQVGPRPEFRADLERPQSATALQTWATCPFRYLLGHVLGVDERDNPADSDEISGLDQGSLVHAVLERFVREHIGRSADEPWTAAERRRMVELADEVAADYADAGRTGRPLLWRLRWGRLRRYLDRILTADHEFRRSLGVSPDAVELGFGFPDTEVGPVTVDAGEGRTVAFRGRIDRIDRAAGGDRVVVLDYKTTPARRYPALTGDPDTTDLTGAGRHLQLLVYAHAARAAYGDVAVDARFFIIDTRTAPTMLGGVVDARADARFREVLTTVADGVEEGRFPARPGVENAWWGFENCTWCPYHRVCPTTRGELWERVRHAPALDAYVELAEGVAT